MQARKHKHDLPLSSTSNGVEQVVPKDLESSKDQSKEKAKLSIKPRIRPLSETKAIDRGANFISEAFLFMVAGSLILFESLRARRRETNRREDVADRLSELEEKQQLALSTISRLRTELARLGSEQTSEPKSSVSTLSRSGIEGVGNDVKIGSPSS